MEQAIRKKIESELSRKRTISTTHNSSGGQRSTKRGGKPSAAKGTVAALKPSPALTVPENITVSEASQLCAAKRTDCVLVVDDEEGLSGIFTAKDLAYRVCFSPILAMRCLADGYVPWIVVGHSGRFGSPHHSCQPNHDAQSHGHSRFDQRDGGFGTHGLQAFQTFGTRLTFFVTPIHLTWITQPVCNEDGNVVGLLDITKVFHEALGKVERSSAASEQLFNAMAGVQSELGGAVGGNPQAAAMLAWAEKLREKTALPDLTTVMDTYTQPATVGPKTTVREVAKLMKEKRTTAVCVMEALGQQNTGAPAPLKIAGIFTSKDVVLRVIAAGLDAGRCSVVRVMTPHPDTAPPSMSVHDALKKMHSTLSLSIFCRRALKSDFLCFRWALSQPSCC